MPESDRAKCPHDEWRDGHCAQMSCLNYINKCPTHATARRVNVHDD